MDQPTIKEKKTFKNTKFFTFIKRHKKVLIVGGSVVVLVIGLSLAFVDWGNNSYDYKVAYNSFSKREVETFSHDFRALDLVEESYGYKEELNLHGYNKDSLVYTLDTNNYVSYEIDVPSDGKYNLSLDYYILHNGLQDSEFSIFMNDLINPILTRVKTRAYWKNGTEDFKIDSYGNEIVPTQQILNKWEHRLLFDYEFTTPLAYEFVLNKGMNTIKFLQTNGGVTMLGKLGVSSLENIYSYSEYINKFGGALDGSRIEEINGVHFLEKNDTTPIPANDPDINAEPYDSYSSKLNVMSNFNNSKQMITYDFIVEKTGLYSLGINGKVDNSNHTTFASIYIDEKIPFGELMHYPFQNNSNLNTYVLHDNQNNPYKFHLTSGKHTISLKIDQSLYNETLNIIAKDIDTLNSVYLDLKRIAGTISDSNKEWNPDKDFPGIIDKLNKVVEELKTTKDNIYSINGSLANFKTTSFIQSVISALNGILKEPKFIPNKYAEFSEGGSSIIQNLANAKEDLTTTPLTIDRIIISNVGDIKISNYKNGFIGFWEGIKKFFHSFVANFSSKVDKNKTIEVWVARSRQYTDLMQQLIDESDFKEKNGYDVKFNILSDEGKLILSNAAKISPDAVMGISNWLPYEMGIRNLTVDLRKFSDYKDVIKRFSKGAFISLIADGKGLALPETQDFYVTYYRKDILSGYGIEKPSDTTTWNDVINQLPSLQRNGFNYYIPLSTSTASKSIMTTAPFIYQYGGNLFSEDATKTTINEENSLNAIKLMTQLYTLYGMQEQVSNFFNSFRNGSLPIGVSTFDQFVKLSLAAPEISGKWDIEVAPGVLNNGKMLRYQTGSATSMTLIDNKNEDKNNAGWELLKWWSSSAIQTEFANRLTLLYGKGYIWNSANIEAFNNSIIFTTSQKKVILKQWEQLREIPKVPGWYILERELSNAWNDIVLSAMNTRSVIENAVSVINKELKRKLIEFGYLNKEGVIVKSYKVTTLESIDEIIKNG